LFGEQRKVTAGLAGPYMRVAAATVLSTSVGSTTKESSRWPVIRGVPVSREMWE